MISSFFKREEFACKCGCGFDVVDIEVLRLLIELRAYFNSPVTVVSGCRCFIHNRCVGGVDSSHHLLGKAVDIGVKGFTPEQVYDYLCTKYHHKYGLGLYGTFVHVDVRQDKARW